MRGFSEIPTDAEFDSGELSLVMDDHNPGRSCWCLPGYFKRLTVNAKVIGLISRVQLTACGKIYAPSLEYSADDYILSHKPGQPNSLASTPQNPLDIRTTVSMDCCCFQDKNNRMSFTLERPCACPITCLPWPFNCTILSPLKVFVRGATGEQQQLCLLPKSL